MSNLITYHREHVLHQSRSRRASWLRLSLILVISVLIHAALIRGLPGLPDWHTSEPVTIEAQLDLAPPPVKPNPPVPTRLAALPLMPRPHIDRSVPIVDPTPTQSTVAAPISAPISAPTQTPEQPDIIATHQADLVAAGNAAGSSAVSGSSGSADRGAQPSSSSALPLAAAPPAAKPNEGTLEYNVTALDPKKPDQSLIGHGTLNFHSEANSYQASLEARVSLLFLSMTVLASQSNGSIGVDGLEPQRYSETPRNKPTSVTNISRDAAGQANVSYAQGGDNATAPAGVQDRLSVLLQVGALMQSNAAWRATDARFSVPVAALKGSVETWNFVVIGPDTVMTDQGALSAIHVTRVVRPGSNDRGIDVWVGEAPAGVPVRVRYTEPGGATIDLVLASSH